MKCDGLVNKNSSFCQMYGIQSTEEPLLSVKQLCYEQHCTYQVQKPRLLHRAIGEHGRAGPDRTEANPK